MSDGSPWRPLGHVEDISAAFLAALETSRELVHNQAFNVGRNQENDQVRQVAEMVREVVPGNEVTSPPTPAGPARLSGRLRQAGQGARRRALLDGPRRRRAAVRSVQGARPDREDLTGSRFQRIAHVRSLLEQGRLDADLRGLGGRSGVLQSL
jgi:hypothetical protein